MKSVFSPFSVFPASGCRAFARPVCNLLGPTIAGTVYSSGTAIMLSFPCLFVCLFVILATFNVVGPLIHWKLQNVDIPSLSFRLHVVAVLGV